MPFMPPPAALHALTVGAIGAMTLAVTTRASPLVIADYAWSAGSPVRCSLLPIPDPPGRSATIRRPDARRSRPCANPYTRAASAVLEQRVTIAKKLSIRVSNC
jgi:hypothetical protein